HPGAGIGRQSGREGGIADIQGRQVQHLLLAAAAGASDQKGRRYEGDDDTGAAGRHGHGSAARPAHSLPSPSRRAPLAGGVGKKPPPVAPSVSMSHVNVWIMTSLGWPMRLRRSTPCLSAAYSSLRL